MIVGFSNASIFAYTAYLGIIDDNLAKFGLFWTTDSFAEPRYDVVPQNVLQMLCTPYPNLEFH